jgi:hypothetical protein
MSRQSHGRGLRTVWRAFNKGLEFSLMLANKVVKLPHRNPEPVFMALVDPDMRFPPGKSRGDLPQQAIKRDPPITSPPIAILTRPAFLYRHRI